MNGRIVAVSVVLVLFVGHSFAKEKPTVSRKQAVAAALARVPGGKVVSSELEREGGTLVWSIDVRDGKNIQEVWVDAKSGQVTKVEKETPDDERKEKDEENERSMKKKH